MNRPLVDQVAEAVLYEGYLLYPYRPSVKNRQRWTFGGLYPPSYREVQAGREAATCRTECLVQGDERSRLRVRVRFLHLQLRRSLGPDGADGPIPRADLAPSGPSHWQEAVERDLDLGDYPLGSLADRIVTPDFDFPGLRDEDTAGVIREQHPIAGRVGISAERVLDGLYKVTVEVRNQSELGGDAASDRDQALLRALVSTHAILGVGDGAFVSMIDPPGPWREIAAGCRNVRTWPVLVGEPGSRDTILSAPIILYDYPQVAPESAGDLFDSTEIDEILTLRILTLTDDEKQAMKAVDDRARALLQRTESLAQEKLLGMHGAIRGLRPL
jgi:hypothetical protein